MPEVHSDKDAISRMSQPPSIDQSPRPGARAKTTAAVFFDPANKRWPRLRLGMVVVGVALTLLFGGLVLSILAAPLLPALHLPNVSFLPHGAHAVPDVPDLAPEKPLSRRERVSRNDQLKLARERERSLRHLLQPPRANLASVDQQPRTIAFFVNWDDASMSSLKENLGSLDTVIAEWLHLSDETGTLRENDPVRTTHVTEYIRARRPDLSLVPLVNNWNGHEWEGAKLGRMLADPAARTRTIEQILAFVEGHRYAGISIDFENVPASAQSDFQRFMAELYAVMHPRKLLVSVNVPADDAAFDYRRLVRNADYLIVMAYDEHWADGTPGPIAGLPWFARVLRARQRDIPADKMIIAIGNYAYDWGPPGHPAEERTFEEAVLIAKESEGKLRLDPVSLNPTFAYADDDDRRHHVWLLDAVTAFNQLVAMRSLQPHGLALWRLGSEDPALWKVFGKKGPLDGERAGQLAEIRFAYGVDYEGKGEVLDVTAQPQVGRRIIHFDAQRGLIDGERFTAFPSPYVITRHGSDPRKIVLTFDDGPDPRSTPQILDALRDAGVPATFFIIGGNGQSHPELLRRAINEGHELGNHTFTHPNISSISPKQLELELSATQHLLASEVGRHSLLFRPPYAVDAEPETIDQVRPIELASQQGYVVVGMQIDPDDWKRPGTDEIVKRVVEGAEQGDGNIVLLHDSGGDRSQTIAAIPRIVEALHQRGFEFVTMAQLLGRDRDAVMPPVPPEDQLRTWFDGAAFAVINLTGEAVDWLFVVGIVLGIARLLFVGGLAIYQRWQQSDRVFDPDYKPTVAVVVPAFNEEKVIAQTIASLLACASPRQFEIIVVDDGSSDATYRVAREAFANDPRVRVFTQVNGGKPAALNFGFAQTGAEIVVALDADTVFTRETISKLVRHFADPRVGAVAGNTKVGNRINLLTRWQALEYITSQNLDRRAFAVLNCITVVPGAVGAWRRELVESAGGFTHDTLAEDADVTLAIRKLDKLIVYEEEAIALTEAPDTVRGFIGQRYRWMYGTMQAAWKHRDVLFRRRYGALGFVALPNVIIFQVLFPLISPIMDLLLAGSLASAAFSHWHHPEGDPADNLWRVLFYYALFVSVDYLAAILAFVLERKESWGLLIWLFWQRFFYRQLMYYVAIKSTLTSLKGVLVGWGRLERKATVNAQA